MSNSARYAKGALLVIAFVLTAVLVFGLWKGSRQKQVRMSSALAPSESEMTLSGIEFTEIEEGRKRWNLRASEAIYFQDEQRSELKDVHLVFFLENGEEIQLQSHEGTLYAGTKDIELIGNVEAQVPRGYRLTTQRAFYRHSEKRIYSETALKVEGPNLQLTGNHWEYQIASQTAEIQGAVNVTLHLKGLAITSN